MSPLNDNRLHTDPEIQRSSPQAGRSAEFETPMQRDRAVTIFEKSKEGRRAFVAPELDVPHQDGLLVAVTEQRSKADIDRLADVLGAAVAAERQTAGVGA